ncbi:MAG: peptidoglycan-binding domain-containing protein, partial [Opitutae bacterium]
MKSPGPSLLFCLLLAGGTLPAATEPEPTLRPEDTPALPAEPEAAAEEPVPAATTEELRPVANWLEAQIELARRGFSSGSIDGIRGAQTVSALRAFQRNAGLPETGELDQPTRENLLLTAPPLATHVFTVEDLARINPVPATWLGKSELAELAHGTALEQAVKLDPDNIDYREGLIQFYTRAPGFVGGDFTLAYAHIAEIEKRD